ncbi:hypothetical protein ACQP2Y_21180 [Actinoplanes sp. CA-051413]|uniref:hypothetical protein n=1 Tax=Actinoplanes sp. CA-051413 TaxID=3239899 RepID=UPI003D987076
MSTRTPRQRAWDEAQTMRVRGQRNDHCVLVGDHQPHVLRIRRGGPGRLYRDAPCGGRGTPVDKEDDRSRWDQPGT